MLKSYGVVGCGWWVAYEILVSAQGPLVLGFLGLGLRGLGPGLDNKYVQCALCNNNRIFFFALFLGF